MLQQKIKNPLKQNRYTMLLNFETYDQYPSSERKVGFKSVSLY